MRYTAILPIMLITGCVMSDDYAGDIVDFNGHMVTIEGGMNQPEGMAVQPTDAMLASASAACGKPARFVGWDNETKSSAGFEDAFMVTYRFLC